MQKKTKQNKLQKNEVVINNVRTFREDIPWSKAKLAREAGLTPQTVAKIEEGISVSRISQLKVAKALGKTISEVFPAEG